MTIHRETADAYHARQAYSASLLWDIVKPDGCPAQAWHDSVFNPAAEAKHAGELDVGTAAHLAVLESHDFAHRCSLVAFDSYRTKEARDLRDECYIDGKVPLLPKEYALIGELRAALQNSEAAELLFGEGESEVSFTWLDSSGLECKARADRITPRAIVDLKTAMSASPNAFSRAMDRDGHHLRAAWYLDGWAENDPISYDKLGFDGKGPIDALGESRPMDYVFVVSSKAAPHIVSIYSTGEVPRRPGWFHIKEESIDWGRKLYQEALIAVRRARESGIWAGYGWEGKEESQLVSLPAYRLNMLYQQEHNGGFDHAEIDGDSIPY